MAWAPSCRCTATFGRCAPIQTGPWVTTSSTTKDVRPSRAPPTTWTSWTITAGADRALRVALVSSTRKRTTVLSAGRKPPTEKTTSDGKKPVEWPKTTKELSFNIAAEEEDHFRRNLVLTMREMLRDPGSRSVDLVEDGRVVARTFRLPEEVNLPDLMNLTLITEDGQNVTLSLRTDNLYVIGFRNGQGTWFEFTHYNANGRTRRERMIEVSTNLGFTGSYVGGDGIGDLIVNMNDPILGRWAVEEAIRGLASYDGTYNNRVRDNATLKRFLRTLIINFIESVRLEPIAELVADQMASYGTTPQDIADRRLTAQDIGLIRSWGRLSEAALQQTRNTDGATPTPSTSKSSSQKQKKKETPISFPELGITAIRDLLRVLAMVHIQNIMGPNKGRRRRAVDDDDGTIGMTLAEVIAVVIRNINDYGPGKLYGTITVTDGLGAFQLYNRDKGDYQKVAPGGKADLVCPPRPISGADDFVIDVDLMDHYTFFGSDSKVALDQVAWNSRDTLSGDYNTILKVPVRGEQGEVEVQYAVVTDAVVAKVEVVLVSSPVRFSPSVYGSVTARTTMASGEPLEYSLLEKAQGQEEVVQEHTAIPLQRDLVSAPLGEEFHVSVDLWHANVWLEPDDHFLNGSVVFTPLHVGTDSKTIMGSNGIVRVDVTWSFSF